MMSNTRVVTSRRPNRLLVALAAGWMVISIAIGGSVQAGTSAEARPAPAIADSTQD